jgi:hypothetical protein
MRTRSIRRLVAAGALFGAPLVLAAPAHAAPPAAPDPAYSRGGYWEAPFDWLTTAAHTVLLPGTATHSQVLYWYDGSSARVWRWNPGDSLHAGVDLPLRPLPITDVHCTGHSLLADGRVLLTGGNDNGPNGLDHVNIWDPVALGWQTNVSTLLEPRWYPTHTTLADGRLLITSGISWRQVVLFGGRDGGGAVHEDLGVAGMRGRADGVWVPGDAAGLRPPPREGAVAGFDDTYGTNAPGTSFPYLQRMLLVGGLDSTGAVLGDAWSLSRDPLSNWTWTPLLPTPDAVHGAPAPRAFAVAAYDRVDSSLVLFGGRDAGGAPLGDVWKLHPYRGPGGRWVRLLPAGGDSTLARSAAAGAFDAIGRRLFVLAGEGATGPMNDAWQLTLGGTPAWTKLAPSGTPPAVRMGAVAVTDRARNRVVLFGGRNGAGPLGDVHALSISGAGSPAWSALSPAPDPVNGTPAPRSHAVAVYDDDQQRLILVGGDPTMAGGGALADLWHLDFRTTLTWKRHPDNFPTGARAGASAVFDTRRINSVLPEIVDPTTLATTALTTARRWQAIYPCLFVLPSGRLVDAAPNFQTLILDPDTGTWQTPPWSISGALTFSAAMYEPGKILACGGSGSTGTSATRRIDLSTNEATATWQAVTGPPGLVPRTTHNLIVLPHGDVAVLGGMGDRNLWATAVRRPQIWSRTTHQWSDTTHLAPDPAVRDYHSVAILLPDGRILSAGGDLRPTPLSRNKQSATIWWPPYLFDDAGAPAARPTVSMSDAPLGYGQTFDIDCPEAADIVRVSLIRPASTTHGFDMEQRAVPLEFSVSGPGQLQAVAPANGNLAPPGWYLLFAVDADSVPAVAPWVLLSPTVSGVPDAGRRLALLAWPNPARDAVDLSFDLPASGPVKVTVHDAAGRRVRVLADVAMRAGPHRLLWDGRDEAGARVASGVYFVSVTGSGASGATRVVLSR